MQPGDQVTVSQSVVVFHHPQHRGQAYDLKGQQGEVVSVLNEWKGRPISPNLPVVVAFGKFRAHFRGDELEPVTA
ncbi:MAG: ferredoxin-thioredoxin reductase variable chain [Cyanobacteriota bacterium]|nr:ferredoxin-thioredoxin reductase variable chain [Cyanobacteriota bacterium]